MIKPRQSKWLSIALMVLISGCAVETQSHRSSRAPIQNHGIAWQDSSSSTPAEPLPTASSSTRYSIFSPATELEFEARILPLPNGSPFKGPSNFEPSDQIDADVISAADILCRAYQQSPIANAIADQRKRFRCCEGDPCAKMHVDELLRLTEVRERQLAASSAAKLVVSLARIQGQQTLLIEARRDIEESLKTISDLAPFTETPIDRMELETRSFDLDNHQAEIIANEIKAQANLRQLIGLHPKESRPLQIESLIDWQPLAPNTDLIALAMERRPDLEATRRLAFINQQGLDVDLTAPLSAIHPVLAVRLIANSHDNPFLDVLFGSDPSSPYCEPKLGDGDVIHEQSRLITTEVVSIQAEIAEAQSRIVNEVNRAEYYQNKLDQLERAAEVRVIDAEQWFRAKLGVTETKSNVLNAVCDLELAYVKLFTSLGTIGDYCPGSGVVTIAPVPPQVPQPAPDETVLPLELHSPAISADAPATLPLPAHGSHMLPPGNRPTIGSRPTRRVYSVRESYVPRWR